jgi:two-component system, chemotaxis family, chemotaxis protein CheY
MAKALVVDDSRAMRNILTKIIAGCGFEVCQASNGREALEVMHREFPAVGLVLADWNMPTMNGLDFVKHLRAEPRYEGVTVVMVTTETHLEQMTAALSAGVNEYVMKPFTAEMIADKLRLLGILH